MKLAFTSRGVGKTEFMLGSLLVHFSEGWCYWKIWSVCLSSQGLGK